MGEDAGLLPSKYDRHLAGEAELTDLEAHGELIYSTSGDCAACRTLPLTTDHDFHNNGVVELLPTKELDLGRYNVTGDPADYRVFKTPTLRNVELTAPYMHDGRFETLEEVIEHYDSGVHSTGTLSEAMRGGDQYGYELHLTDEEKLALLAFLKTLTDHAILTDPLCRALSRRGRRTGIDWPAKRGVEARPRPDVELGRSLRVTSRKRSGAFGRRRPSGRIALGCPAPRRRATGWLPRSSGLVRRGEGRSPS